MQNHTWCVYILYFYAYYARIHVVFQENLHSWQKFYTTAGRDGRDKSQLCKCPMIIHNEREKLNVETRPNHLLIFLTYLPYLLLHSLIKVSHQANLFQIQSRPGVGTCTILQKGFLQKSGDKTQV